MNTTNRAKATSLENAFVSVIIPCLNEESCIRICLDSVLQNTFPNEKMEIFIVDGMSHDKTREIVKDYSSRFKNIFLLDNPKKTAPAALNVGIKQARGNVIVRLDAHTTYSPDYISKSVESLFKSDAVNIGGVIETMPGSDTHIAKSISLALSHFFGVGPSYFRIGSNEPRYADTVPFGCFRRELFDEIGLFDESRPRNEDIDFNQRIRASGKKILLNRNIKSYYFARGTFKEFFWHNFDNGRLVTAPIGLKQKNVHSFRHFVPIICFFALIALIALSTVSKPALITLVSGFVIYFGLNFYFSFKAALRERKFIYLLTMPFTFATLHFSYGLGSIYGLIQNSFFMKRKTSKSS